MKEIPQLDKYTGLSHDYFNEFAAFLSSYQFGDSHQSICRQIREQPLRKYAERFSPLQYSAVLTEANRERIEYLDALVDRINYGMPSGEMSKKEFLKLIEAADTLIRGSLTAPGLYASLNRP